MASRLSAETPIGPTRAAPRTRLARWLSFGAVGGVSFIVDVGLYNILRIDLLAQHPITDKIVSVAAATLVAWLGNRLLTFRGRQGKRRTAVVKEAALFAGVNVLGLGIATACLFVSHYLLGFRSALADNISGNGIGLVLGMVFRYLAYSVFVFRGAGETASSDRGGIDAVALIATEAVTGSAPRGSDGFISADDRDEAILLGRTGETEVAA